MHYLFQENHAELVDRNLEQSCVPDQSTGFWINEGDEDVQWSDGWCFFLLYIIPIGSKTLFGRARRSRDGLIESRLMSVSLLSLCRTPTPDAPDPETPLIPGI